MRAKGYSSAARASSTRERANFTLAAIPSGGSGEIGNHYARCTTFP